MEIKVVADLEFRKKQYFTTDDIEKHFANNKQMINTIYTLRKKGRIVKLSKKKYFLIPIKARKGKWTDDPFTIADEMFDGKNYFIGGWAAANFWRLTDQIPLQIDIYTTQRQGKINILNNRFVFHRTTKNKVNKSITKKSSEHDFKIISKKEAEKWMKLRT